MDILIFVEEIIDNASGIVNKRLLLEMAQKNKLVIYCFGCAYKELLTHSNIEMHLLYKYTFIRKQYWHFTNLSLAIMGTDLADELLKKKISKCHKIDIILSLSYSVHLWSIIAGKYAKSLYNRKWVTYFIDPLPPHVHFGKFHPFPSLCKSFIKRKTDLLDLAAGSNSKMMSFQKKYIANKLCESDFYYTSYDMMNIKLVERNLNESYLLYTGSLKERKVLPLLKAFASIIQSNSTNLKLVFVGSEDISKHRSAFAKDIQSKILLFPRTNDLTRYYENAVALIDIDPDIEDNVYLSSKITNYIFINRPIICITERDSPSKLIFGGCQSMLFCKNAELEIFETIKYVIYNLSNFLYEDRLNILKQFSTEYVTKKLILKLSELSKQ